MREARRLQVEPAHNDPDVFISVQPEPPDPPRTSESISEIDISNPYALANSLDGYSDVEMEDLWKRLRVKSAMNDVFFTRCSACSAEVFAFNLDDSPQNEIIVRIANSVEECRYLVFGQIESDTTKYKLIGNIDHDFGRYQMPSHHFIVSNGRAYLVIRGQTQSGSGVSAYNYRLFRVKSRRLKELLEFPADGHETLTMADPAREWSARVRDVTPLTGGATRIELDLTIDYSVEDYDGDGPVRGGNWTKRERAVYFKPAGDRKAYLDSENSTVSQQQLDAEYNVDSLDDEGLVRYNRDHLRRAGWKPLK